jgi:hypothetical protein
MILQKDQLKTRMRGKEVIECNFFKTKKYKKKLEKKKIQ